MKRCPLAIVAFAGLALGAAAHAQYAIVNSQRTSMEEKIECLQQKISSLVEERATKRGADDQATRDCP